VSDIAHKAPTFFALYSEGQVTADQIDDYVGAWHESDDGETREPHEYFGLTWEELMTSRALPMILAARRAKRPLREFLEPFFQTLKARNDPNDKAALHAMSYRLYRHPPAD